MEMSQQTRDSKRDGARLFGVIFQALAVVALLGTVYAAVAVAKLGTQLGIGGSGPAPWVVLVIGIFVSCVLAGFGYTLGILCAIYDRQEPPLLVVDPYSRRSLKSQPAESASYRPGPITLDADETAAQTTRSTSPPTPEVTVTPTSSVTEQSSVGEWLTRERHLRRSEQH